MIDRRSACHVVLHQIFSCNQLLHFAFRLFNLVLHHVVARLQDRICVALSVDLQVLFVGELRLASLVLLEDGVGTAIYFANAHPRVRVVIMMFKDRVHEQATLL